MTSSAVALVLASALLHAWLNARSHAGDDRIATFTLAYATGAVVLTPWLIADPPTEVAGLVAVSGCAHAAYLTLLAGAYQRGSLAIAYPLARGTAPLVVAVVAVWFLDQDLTAALLAGAIVLGAGLMTIGGVAWGTGQRQALAFDVATGAMIATYSLVDARGVDDTGALGYFAAVSVVGAVVMGLAHRQAFARLRSSARAGVEIGVASALSYVLILLAFTRADAGRVATLRGTSILFGLVFARRVVSSRIVAGAGMVVAGAGLVVL